MGNKTAIANILGKKKSVMVLNETVELSVPDVEKAHEALAVLKQAISNRKIEDISIGEQMDVARELSVKCIAATVKIDETMAEQLYMISGGETSHLATAAKELCGVPVNPVGEDDVMEDPTF